MQDKTAVAPSEPTVDTNAGANDGEQLEVQISLEGNYHLMK